MFLLSFLVAVAAVTALYMLVLELRGEVRPVSPQEDQKGRTSSGAVGRLARIPVGWWARIALAFAVAGLVAWVTRWPVAVGACAVMVLSWPAFTAGRRAERQEIEVLEAVVVWTQGLRDTVSGGASLEQAIGVSVDQAPPALQEGLDRVRGRLMVREPLDAALAPLQDVPGADFVTAALTLAARRRGDRLPDVLSGIVDTCSQEVAQRRQILAARAGIHRSVQIIIGVTLAILTWMATVGAAYMAPYDSASGQGVLALAIGVIAIGFFWLARLDTTVSGPRFFTPSLSSGETRIVTGLARPQVLDLASGGRRREEPSWG
ncbi:hypothetical protein GCM10027456_39900 [Kineosporia babensis]